MSVLVASQNEIKRLAVVDAYTEIYPEDVPVVVSSPLEIRSGVRDQPLSLQEIALGVHNRIGNARAQKIGRFSTFVAIESGCYRTKNRWFEVACAGVTGRNGRISIAYGPSYPVPESFVPLLKQGKDLNEIMEEKTSMKEAGKGIGFNGWLAGRFDRRHASAMAVYLALCSERTQDL